MISLITCHDPDLRGLEVFLVFEPPAGGIELGSIWIDRKSYNLTLVRTVKLSSWEGLLGVRRRQS